jgi:ATP-dependent Clp protease adaptor protein ClpS
MGIQDREQEGGVATDTRTEKKLARPRLYKVLFHNDDYTTMEFVVALLQHVFHHSEATATAIMLHVHQRGVGVAGVYTHEIAETKVGQVMELAQRAEFPLQCTMEPDDAPGEEPGE